MGSFFVRLQTRQMTLRQSTWQVTSFVTLAVCVVLAAAYNVVVPTGLATFTAYYELNVMGKGQLSAPFGLLQLAPSKWRTLIRTNLELASCLLLGFLFSLRLQVCAYPALDTALGSSSLRSKGRALLARPERQAFPLVSSSSAASYLKCLARMPPGPRCS